MSRYKTRGGTIPTIGEPHYGKSYEQIRAHSESVKAERLAKRQRDERLAISQGIARQNAITASEIATRLEREASDERKQNKMWRDAFKWEQISRARAKIMKRHINHNKPTSSTIDCDAVNIFIEHINSMFDELTGHTGFTKSSETNNVVRWSLKDELNGGVIQKLFNKLQETLVDTPNVLSEYQEYTLSIIKQHLHQIDESLETYFKSKMTTDASIAHRGVKDHESTSMYKVKELIKITELELNDYFEEVGWDDANKTNIKDKFYKICKSLVLKLKPIYTLVRQYYTNKGIHCNETLVFPTTSLNRSMKSTFGTYPEKSIPRSNSDFGFDDIYTSEQPIRGMSALSKSISKRRNNSAGGGKTRKSKRKTRKYRRKRQSKK